MRRQRADFSNEQNLSEGLRRAEGSKTIKENTSVDQNLVVHFDDDPVRFTPDGKVSVLDAIKALTQLDCPRYLWDDLKRNHPEILRHCGSYSFQKGQSLPVVDNAGWDMLSTVLIDYLGDSDFSCPDQVTT
jgi:hypothetical protein